MTKMSAYELKNLLGQVPDTINSLVEENERLTEKVAYYDRLERVRKIASTMEDKGLSQHLSYEDKINNLMEEDESKLDRIEGAIELSSQGIPIKVAKLAQENSMQNYLDMLR